MLAAIQVIICEPRSGSIISPNQLKSLILYIAINSRAMKPNTYTKLYVHCVFAPKGRESLLNDSINEKIHKYIYGIIKGQGCFPVNINGTKDHIHILMGFKPEIAIADLIRDIKRSSSLYLNEHVKSPFRFSWQEGYGAFTVGYRDLDRIFHYISEQQEHHKGKRFREEYMQLLIDEGVDYKPEYLYEFYDSD
jgi:putative transposase